MILSNSQLDISQIDFIKNALSNHFLFKELPDDIMYKNKIYLKFSNYFFRNFYTIIFKNFFLNNFFQFFKFYIF